MGFAFKKSSKGTLKRTEVIDMAKKHADGTTCLEGTRRVPIGFRPCCPTFAAHTVTCAYDIRYEYWSKRKQWLIVISESAGGGGIAISFCPHCGSKLRREERREREKKALKGAES